MNCYEVLELDPSIVDWPSIETRIQEKQRKWSRDSSQGSPKARAQANIYLSELPRIRSVLEDKQTRQEEAKAYRRLLEAKRRKQEGKLEGILEVWRAAGNTVPLEAVRKAAKNVGISEPYFKAYIIRMGLIIAESSEAVTKKERPKLEPSIVDQIDRNLKVVKINSLFEFLEVPVLASEKVIQTKIEIKESQFARGSVSDPKVQARKELLALARSILLSENSRLRYQNTLAVQRMVELRANIEAAGEDRVITTAEMAVLTKQAKALDVNIDLAREYIREYAEQRKWVIQSELDIKPKDKGYRCGYCGTVCRDRSREQCEQCGENLHRTCPRCARRISTDASTCPYCYANIDDISLLNGYLAVGRRLFVEENYDAARREFEKALLIWDDWAPALREIKRVQIKAHEQKTVLEQVHKLVHQRRLEEARILLSTKMNALRDKKNSNEASRLLVLLEEQIQRAELLVEEGRRLQSKDKNNKAYEKFELALSICSDFIDARKALEANPPSCPPSLRIEQLPSGLRVRWSRSSSLGTITYRILRKQGGRPSHSKDGVVVADTEQLEIDDLTIPVGEVWYYAIFACRAGVFSQQMVASHGQLVTGEVRNLVAVTQSSQVTLRWLPPAGALWIEAVCERPKQRTIVASTSNSLVDSNLQDGVQYVYRVRAVYLHPSQKNNHIRTRGVMISAAPMKPPEPVNNISYSRSGKYIYFKWRPVEGAAIEIWQISKNPRFDAGSIVSLEEMRSLGSKINPDGNLSAKVSLNSQGESVFVPVSIRGDTAVLGDFICFYNLDPVSSAKSELRTNNIYLRWHWPEGLQKVVICCRYDTFPKTIGDYSDGIRLECERSEYEKKGCFVFNATSTKIHYFSIFSTVEDLQTSSAPTHLIEPMGLEEIINYRIRTRRRGAVSLVENFLEISTQSKSIPPMILVAKQGYVPTSPTDGEVVKRFARLDIEGVTQFKIDSKPKPDIYLKLFFQDASYANLFRLLPAPRQHLKLRFGTK